MADRLPGKSKKQAKKPPVPSVRGRAAPAAARDQVALLTAECERLKAELAQAAKRLEALEAQRKELLDHIDWAIDSLHSLLGE